MVPFINAEIENEDSEKISEGNNGYIDLEEIDLHRCRSLPTILLDSEDEEGADNIPDLDTIKSRRFFLKENKPNTSK